MRLYHLPKDLAVCIGTWYSSRGNAGVIAVYKYDMKKQRNARDNVLQRFDGRNGKYGRRFIARNIKQWQEKVPSPSLSTYSISTSVHMSRPVRSPRWIGSSVMGWNMIFQRVKGSSGRDHQRIGG